MKKVPIQTKGERRERKRQPRMAVQGASVKRLQRILLKRAGKDV